MAQLGTALRIVFTSASLEEAGGVFALQRKPRDQRIRLEWRAETPDGIVAEGSSTLAEIRWWKEWFSAASQVRNMARKLGKAPADPVARLWTPLAGQTVEFFAWPDPVGGLAVLALFLPDERSPQTRTAVEMTVSESNLAAFGTALESEAEDEARGLRAEG